VKVVPIRATEEPERLVCQAARGDYSPNFVGETEYAELMEPVSGSDLNAKTTNLIEKQLSRGHYGPFEHPQITFAISGVSRVTMAQVTRHRHLTFDVQSMRYADFSEAGVVFPAALLSADERAARYPHVFDEGEAFASPEGEMDITDEHRDMLQHMYRRKVRMAVNTYEHLVAEGVPKEDARFVLPLGTPVNMTVSGNARTMLHLLNMRNKPDAQWEIRELSERLLEHLFEWMPRTFEYYDERGPKRLSP